MENAAFAKILDSCLTTDQAARLAGCHAATVRRAFDRGELDGFSSTLTGRLILRSSAEAWAAERNTGRRLAA